MCRCCQECLEELYWSCIGEKFCYDESIANYNPDDDDYFQRKNGGLMPPVQQNDNNNMPICTQPINRNNSTNRISSKIHEEDYRREIQTNVPILAPEILAVFATSQIFVDHQSKMTKSLTKTSLPGMHSLKSNKEDDQEKLIKQLEGGLDYYESISTSTSFRTISDKKIKFTIAPESSPEAERRSLSSQKFESIEEEDDFKDEVILRPKIIAEDVGDYSSTTSIITTGTTNNEGSQTLHERKPLRNVQSVPYFSFRPASETDIFAISGSLSRISMTPEVPSISYSTLPKNYEDTPTLEKYKESVSLYSIQAANQARASDVDYSMPRYFRKSAVIGQSMDSFEPTSLTVPATTLKPDPPKRAEKSKRLKHLRGSLPPLLIHSIRSRKDDMKLINE